MGIFDDLKHKAEELGDKAKEGLDAAKDKASDLLDDAKDKAGDLVDDAKGRFGHDDGSPLTESSDVGPDSTSTDAEQPGYVTAEDDVADTESDESALDGVDDADTEDELAEDSDDSAAAVPPAAPQAAVATDVDPYDEPLTESIGDEIVSAPVDREAVAESVDSTATGQDSST